MEPRREEKLEQLEKLLQSQTLQGAESLRTLLRFLALRGIDHQETQLKEYTIATEVFGRNRNYDPQIDSVVRVQAGRLRHKLQHYYATEGENDQVLLGLPRGSYLPTFSYTRSDSQQPATDDSTAPAPPASPIAGARSDQRLRLIISGLVVVSLALVAATLHYRAAAKRPQTSPPTPAASSTERQALSLFWDDFLGAPEPVLIAYSNTIFQGSPATGMKYLKPWKPSPPAQPGSASDALPRAASAAGWSEALVFDDHYTGVGEVVGVYLVGGIFKDAGRSVRIKRSLLLTWEDVRKENIVFLGSPTENLLLRDLPQEQDFIFGSLEAEPHNPPHNSPHNPGTGIINIRPRANEEK
ncbi:MAG: hypothetical protein ACREEM_35390 [Blastocatellia bacterium]